MRKLYRSRRDKKVTGLCGGLAEVLNIDPTLLRVIVIITAIFSTGFPVIAIYIIASLVIPKEPGFDPPIPGGMYGGMQPPYPGGNYGNAGYQANGQVGHTGHTAHTGHGGHRIPHGTGFAGGQSYNPGASAGYPPQPPTAPPVRDELDEMMKDIEKKALRKEIEELKAKLGKYEKGDV